MKMSEVMNGPSGQKLRQRYDAQLRVPSTTWEILRLYHRLQRSDIFSPQMCKLVQELFQRFALALFELCKAVEGIERPRFAVLQYDPQAWHPIGTFRVDKVAQDVERGPGVASFITARPDVGHPT